MEARQYVTRDKSKYFIVLSFLLCVCGKMMVYTRWNLRSLLGKPRPCNSLQAFDHPVYECEIIKLVAVPGLYVRSRSFRQ